MERFPEVNWSDIARRSITQYIEDRNRSTIPEDILSKLRREKGQENVRGREFALKNLLPKSDYKELETTMTNISEKTRQFAELESQEQEVEIQFVDWGAARLKAGKQILRDRIPSGSSLEFLKGVLASLDEAYNLALKD